MMNLSAISSPADVAAFSRAKAEMDAAYELAWRADPFPNPRLQMRWRGVTDLGDVAEMRKATAIFTAWTAATPRQRLFGGANCTLEIGRPSMEQLRVERDLAIFANIAASKPAWSAKNFVAAVSARGVTLSVNPAGKVCANLANLLTESDCKTILEHRGEIVAFLGAAAEPTVIA